MSDTDLRELERKAAQGDPEAEFAAKIEAQRTQRRPWGEAADHAWCRTCRQPPAKYFNGDGHVFIFCPGFYRSSEPHISSHPRDQRYKMTDDGHWCCNGSPCNCIEICPGWEWAVE